MRVYSDTEIPTTYGEHDAYQNDLFPNEKALQEHVRITFTKSALPWLYYHVGDSRRDYAGYPDVTAVHIPTGAILFVELKAGKKARVSAAQMTWLLALSASPCCEVYLIRPSELGELYDAIERIQKSVR